MCGGIPRSVLSVSPDRLVRVSRADLAAAPLLSVVVIVYNDAARLPAAVRSVLRQTLKDLEVVIVDDASTDDTAVVSHRLAAGDPRVRVGGAAPNNRGGRPPPPPRGRAPPPPPTPRLRRHHRA